MWVGFVVEGGVEVEGLEGVLHGYLVGLEGWAVMVCVVVVCLVLLWLMMCAVGMVSRASVRKVRASHWFVARVLVVLLLFCTSRWLFQFILLMVVPCSGC